MSQEPNAPALEYLAILTYVWAAERLQRLGYLSRRFPEMLLVYAAWDARRLESGRQNWGP